VKIVCFLTGLLLLAAGTAAGTAAGREVVKLTITPAWNGHARAEAMGEIAVKIDSDAARKTRVVIQSGRQITEVRFDVDGGVPRTVFVPVPVGADGFVTATAFSDDNRIARSAARLFTPLAGKRFVPMASPQAVDGLPISINVSGLLFLPGSIDTWPHTAAGYAAADAVVLYSGELRRMTADQLNAFGLFAADCGRILLVVTDNSQLEAEIAKAAGCAARFVQRVGNIADLPASLDRLLAQPRPSLPDAAELAPLFDEMAGPARFALLIAFVLGYFAVLGLSVFISRNIWLPLLAIVAMTGLGGVIWYWGVPLTQAVVWGKSTEGDRWRRETVVIHVHGRGKASLRLRPAGYVLDRSSAANDLVPVYEIGRDGSWQEEIIVQTFLFSKHEIVFRRVVGQPPVARLTGSRGKSGLLALGSTLTRGSLLSLDGTLYDVPGLKQRETWHANGNSARQAGTQPERLFVRQTDHRSPALLVFQQGGAPSPLFKNVPGKAWHHLELTPSDERHRN
jgi:hypothetical protein